MYVVFDTSVWLTVGITWEPSVTIRKISSHTPGWGMLVQLTQLTEPPRIDFGLVK